VSDLHDAIRRKKSIATGRISKDDTSDATTRNTVARLLNIANEKIPMTMERRLVRVAMMITFGTIPRGWILLPCGNEASSSNTAAIAATCPVTETMRAVAARQRAILFGKIFRIKSHYSTDPLMLSGAFPAEYLSGILRLVPGSAPNMADRFTTEKSFL
jgi:hypothetical protein